MSWRSPYTLFVTMVVLTILTTSFIKVPLPTRGYFNFGDIAVVFSGLAFGKYASTRFPWLGGIAGGVGSALADVVSGYAIFAPATFVAKTFEGLLAAAAAGRTGAIHYLLLVIGGLGMVATYFCAEWLFPAYGGPAAAIMELAPNFVQAAGGLVGGLVLFRVFDIVVKSGDVE